MKPLRIKAIQHDSGTSYTSQAFPSFMKDRGITDLVTSIALPTSNGAAERAVRSVKRLLWSWHAVRRLPWASLCAAVAKQLNTTNRRVLGAGKTPAELLQKAREDALDPEDQEAFNRGQGPREFFDLQLNPEARRQGPVESCVLGGSAAAKREGHVEAGQKSLQNYTKQVYTIAKKVGRDFTLREKPGYKYDRAMLLKIIEQPRDPSPEQERPATVQPTPAEIQQERQATVQPAPADRPRRERRPRQDDAYAYY